MSNRGTDRSHSLLENIPEELRSMTHSLADLRQSITQLSGGLTPSLAEMRDLIEGLPRLTEQDIIQLGLQDSPCPICFNPFLAILSEEEMAIAMDSPAHPVEHLGVTRLAEPWQCGHTFCRRDISKWIFDSHDSCPMCRHLLLKPREPSNTNGSLDLPVSPAPLSLQGADTIHQISREFAGQSIDFEDMVGSSQTGLEDEDVARNFSGMYS